MYLLYTTLTDWFCITEVESVYCMVCAELLYNTHTQTHTYKHTHTNTHTQTYTQTHAHKHTHTNTHAHFYTQFSKHFVSRDTNMTTTTRNKYEYHVYRISFLNKLSAKIIKKWKILCDTKKLCIEKVTTK